MQYTAQNVYSWLQSTFTLSKLRSKGEEGQRKNNIDMLDGVRAIAALAVLTFHLYTVIGLPWVKWQNPLASSLATFGGSGVTLFFILSGFLLFMPYAKALLFQEKWPSVRNFYTRRALRIIPGYYVALFLMIIFFQQKYLQPAYWKQLGLFLTFLMDSTPQTWRQLNGPFWTLAIEWQFYMLLPWIALGFSYVVRYVSSLFAQRHRLLIAIGCCFGLITWGLFIRYVGIHFAKHPHDIFFIPSSVLKVALFFLYGMQGKYLENFALGMIISLCYIYAQHPTLGKNVQYWAERSSQWLWGFGLLVLVFTGIWHFQVLELHVPVFRWLDPLKPNFDWLNEMVIAIGYGSCVAAIIFGSSGLKRMFSWQPLRWVGLISFGLYMWHLPLLYLFRDNVLPFFEAQLSFIHMGPMKVLAAYLLWIAVFIIPAAYLSYVLVERPWIQLGNKRRKKEQPYVASTSRTSG